MIPHVREIVWRNTETRAEGPHGTWLGACVYWNLVQRNDMLSPEKKFVPYPNGIKLVTDLRGRGKSICYLIYTERNVYVIASLNQFLATRLKRCATVTDICLLVLIGRLSQTLMLIKVNFITSFWRSYNAFHLII